MTQAIYVPSAAWPDVVVVLAHHDAALPAERLEAVATDALQVAEASREGANAVHQAGLDKIAVAQDNAFSVGENAKLKYSENMGGAERRLLACGEGGGIQGVRGGTLGCVPGSPPLSWSTVNMRKGRIRDGEQATQTGRDCHKAATGRGPSRTRYDAYRCDQGSSNNGTDVLSLA